MSVLEPAPLAEDASIGLDAQGANHRWRAAVAILTLTGAGLVLLSTAKYGAGISPDSATYLDVARSLVSGKGFVYHTGEPLVWWPPFYSILLALIGFASSLDPAAFAHIVNAVLFALVIYLSARLFRAGFRQNTTYGLLGVCAVLFSIPLSDVYTTASSDCLLIPLLLLFLLSAQRYWDSGSVGTLAVMTISTGLAFLTSYRGMAIVPAGILTVILASRLNIWTRVRHACAFAGLSLAPIGLWLVCNPRVVGAWYRDGSAPGPEDPGGFLPLFADNLADAVRKTITWYLPRRTAWPIVLAVAVAVGALAAIASSRTVRERFVSSVRSILLDSPGVLLFVTYLLVLVSLLSAKHTPFIERRYLAPLFVPATLILLKLVARLFNPPELRVPAFARKIPPILVALSLCFPLATVAGSAVARFKNGAGGYNTKIWHEGGTIAYARQMLSVRDDAPVYSNGPDALWALASVNATMIPDRRVEVNLSELKRRWPAEGGSVLVWFSSISWRPYLYSVEELSEVAHVVELAHFSDGSIYRVSVRDTATPY